MAEPVKRPASVTLVMVLTWLVAILSVVGGMFFLFAKDDVLSEAGIDSTIANGFGVFEIGFGAVSALVALGLGRGSRFARFLVSLLMGLRMIAALWAAIALSGHKGFWTSAAAGAIAVLILALLWNGKADAYFRKS